MVIVLCKAVNGQLPVTDDFLRLLIQRPELELVAESCAAEHALHAALLEQPSRAVSAADIKALADPDAQENYQVVLAFRDLLLAQNSLESAYLAVCQGKVKSLIAPVFIDWLVQVIVRHQLDSCDDVYQWRAAELLFRRQKVSIEQGILLADAELLARRQPQSMTVIQSLVQQAMVDRTTASGVPVDNRQTLEVLNQDNQTRYWQRSEAFDFVMSLNLDEVGVHALCRVLETWVKYFHDVECRDYALSQY